MGTNNTLNQSKLDVNTSNNIGVTHGKKHIGTSDSWFWFYVWLVEKMTEVFNLSQFEENQTQSKHKQPS